MLKMCLFLKISFNGTSKYNQITNQSKMHFDWAEAHNYEHDINAESPNVFLQKVLITSDHTFRNESHSYFLTFSEIYITVDSTQFP